MRKQPKSSCCYNIVTVLLNFLALRVTATQRTKLPPEAVLSPVLASRSSRPDAISGWPGPTLRQPEAAFVPAHRQLIAVYSSRQLNFPDLSNRQLKHITANGGTVQEQVQGRQNTSCAKKQHTARGSSWVFFFLPRTVSVLNNEIFIDRM